MRKSAEERRTEVVRAAMSAFAVHGLQGTSTGEIAGMVGVSQPYLFRLFTTKKALFLAATELCFTRIRDTFARAAEGLSGAEAMHGMGKAYYELLSDRDLLLFQMQLYAACADPEISTAAQRHWDRLWDFVGAITGADDQELVRFFSMGTALNTFTAIRLPGEHRLWSCLWEEMQEGEGGSSGPSGPSGS